jgi:hypothetical protein
MVKNVNDDNNLNNNVIVCLLKNFTQQIKSSFSKVQMADCLIPLCRLLG